MACHKGDRIGSKEYYKGQYEISFYDRNAEEFIDSFNNVREILKWLGRPITRQNINEMNVHIYKCLKKTPLPRIRFSERKGIMTIWLIPLVDEDERELAFRQLNTKRYIRWKDNECNEDWYEIVAVEDTYVLLKKCVILYKNGRHNITALSFKPKCEDINHVFYHLVHTENYKLFDSYEESLEDD